METEWSTDEVLKDDWYPDQMGKGGQKDNTGQSAFLRVQSETSSINVFVSVE